MKGKSKKKKRTIVAREDIDAITRAAEELKALKEKLKAANKQQIDGAKKLRARVKEVCDLICKEVQVGVKPQGYGAIKLDGKFVTFSLSFRTMGYVFDKKLSFNRWKRLDHVKPGHLTLGSIDFRRKFPASYLAMSDKAILEDVRARVKTSKVDEAERKAKAAAEARKKEEDRKLAFSKLSEYERKLLGIRKAA